MALLACFAFAELGGMFPHAGGQYVYMREAYGDTAGFLYGWMYFTVSATGTVAALGVGFATYLGQTFPVLHAEQVILPLRFVDVTRGHLIALAAIALQTLINIFGVKKGAILQNVATWAKFGAIAIFVVGGLFLGHGSWDHFRHSLIPAANEHVSIVTGVGIALIAVFWAYDGWVYVTFVGGEIKDPQRNVPRALIWGLLLVGVVYISINAVYVYALPMNEITAQEAVAQTAAVSMFSGRVAPWLSMMVALSCFGAMAPCLMSGARVYYAMAEDGIFFHALAKVHPRWHTPDEPGAARDLGRSAHAQRQIRRAFYLRDVHDGAELRVYRGGAVCVATEKAGPAAPIPMHRISLVARDLRGAGQPVGDQRRGGKKKRDAGGDRDRAAGSTILSLLEETEESEAARDSSACQKSGSQDVL